MRALILGVAAALLAGAVSAQPYQRDDRQDGRYDRGGAEQRDNQRGDRDGDQRYDHRDGRRYDHRDYRRSGWGQDYGNRGHHWRYGERMGYNDWNGAQRIDYRRYRLRQPPRGYEWRQSNGQFVMAAIATGVIASIIISNGR